MYFAIYYIPEKRVWEEILVCFVDVRTYLAYDHDSAQKREDDYMRDKFLEFSSSGLALPKLYGISALGTLYAVYEYRTHDRALAPMPEVVNVGRCGIMISLNPRERRSSSNLWAKSKRWWPLCVMFVNLITSPSLLF